MKKSLSIILLILGIGIFVYGNRMSQEVAQGQANISQAEENQQSSHRPIVGPIRRNMRNNAEETAQGRINAAELKVGKSQVTANWLQGVGIALFVVGTGCLIACCCRKK